MKKFIFFLVALFLFIQFSKPLGSTRACGWGPEEFFYGYSFFDPVMTEQSDYSALFMSFNRFYDLEWNEDEFRWRDNITEWQDFYNGKPSRDDIAQIVYKETSDNLIEAKKYVEKKSNNLPDSLTSNSVIQYWKKKKMSSPICYLVYAKKLEPQVTIEDDAWGDEKRNLVEMEALIGEGVERYDACKNQFLKMRYGYQIVRLAHYAGKYEDAIKFHDDLVEPLKEKVKSEIYYWSLGHKAGAMMLSGNDIQASYLFSKVFENSPAKRIPSWLSFSISSDDEWDACLTLCQNESEKANLYFMRAINPVSQVIEEMESIYAIDPESEKLDILLAREINKLEYDFFDYNYDFEMPLKESYEGRSKATSLKYLKDLRQFTNKINREKKIGNPTLWKVAEGYLAFMESDFDIADQTFAEIESTNAGKPIATYAQLFQWIVSVNQLKEIDINVENSIWEKLQKVDLEEKNHDLNEKAQRYLNNVMAKKYSLQGDIGKAFLCTRDLYLLYMRPSKELAQDLIDWVDEVETRGATEFEKYLLGKINPENQRAFILEILGTMELKDGNLEAAIAAFEQIPEEARGIIPAFNIPGDPFKAQTIDCLDCESDEVSEYTKLEFAQKILDLMKEAEETSEKAAENYFLIGNAFYNMTFFGHGWSAAGYFRSGSYWSGIGASPDHWAYSNLEHLNLDMKMADEYYQKTIDFTEEDRELAAQATFMAAKCEQNQFFLDGYNHGDHLQLKMDNYRSRFDELINDYSNTEYYQRVIKECHFLDNYNWYQENK